jgi:regulator of protease activity HflC (stomatin/prohibitin superfamily)
MAAVHAIGQSSARATIGRFEYDKITREKSAINVELCTIIDKTIDTWGIDCTRFEIQDFKPQSVEIARQLELQMEAERKRRENELVTLGKIRPAEGERDAAILKSLGELEANKNLAEANYVAVQRQADSRKYEMDLITKAHTNQIAEIAKQFAGDTDRASWFILEQLRLLNLGKVAAGPNNNTYFMPHEYASLKVMGDLFSSSSSSVSSKRRTDSTAADVGASSPAAALVTPPPLSS